MMWRCIAFHSHNVLVAGLWESACAVLNSKDFLHQYRNRQLSGPPQRKYLHSKARLRLARRWDHPLDLSALPLHRYSDPPCLRRRLARLRLPKRRRELRRTVHGYGLSWFSPLVEFVCMGDGVLSDAGHCHTKRTQRGRRRSDNARVFLLPSMRYSAAQNYG